MRHARRAVRYRRRAQVPLRGTTTLPNENGVHLIRLFGREPVGVKVQQRALIDQEPLTASYSAIRRPALGGKESVPRPSFRRSGVVSEPMATFCPEQSASRFVRRLFAGSSSR